MSRRVLLTGGAGALGGSMATALQQRGWIVRALVHRRSVLDAAETVRGDVRSGDLRPAVEEVDAVLHLAAVTHARRTGEYFSVNVTGTQRLVEAAQAAGVRRFVHVSTRAISPDGGAYSRSKLAAEEVVRSSRLEHTILRPAEVYGAGGNEGVDRIVAVAKRGGAVPVVGRGEDQICPIVLDDLVEPLATALASADAAGKTYTLAGECLSVREFALACASVFGTRVRLVPIPALLLAGLAPLARALPLPFYPDQLARLQAPKAAASPDARDDLGFAPRPLEDGLRELADAHPGVYAST